MPPELDPAYARFARRETPTEGMRRIERDLRSEDFEYQERPRTQPNRLGSSAGRSNIEGYSANVGAQGPLSAGLIAAGDPMTGRPTMGGGRGQAGPLSYQYTQPTQRGAHASHQVGATMPFNADAYFGVTAQQGPDGRTYGVNAGGEGWNVYGGYNPSTKALNVGGGYQTNFAGGGPVVPTYDPMGSFTGMEGVDQGGRDPGMYERLADRLAGAGVAVGEPARQAIQGVGAVPSTIGTYLAETAQKPDPSQRVAEDIRKFGSAFAEQAMSSPTEFAKTVGGFLPGIGEGISAYDAAQIYEELKHAESVGDTRKADTLRQLYGLAAAGAVPGVGMAARVAGRAKRGAMAAGDVAESAAIRGVSDDLAKLKAAEPEVVEGAERAASKVASDDGKNIEKVVAELSKSTPEEVSAAREANKGRGLEFPAEEGLDRLRMNLQRAKKAKEKGVELPGGPANERMVIRAPEGKPDFVIGKLTPEDWINRAESMMSPTEIKEAADWYKTIRGEFLKYTDGDVPKADQYMRAWLVAQQNVDVAGAMNNVLLQREQFGRGVPIEQMRAAGMPNPTEAARAVIGGSQIEGGVGQKIADFVDAAEGKNVRSWMANHPEGGSPFVVDVHTARDTGLVDETLLNHLRRLGYNEEDIAKARVDLQGTPSATQYENRASWGRNELVDHLNEIKWQGKDDWTPAEAQAVGWMGMTRLTADKAEDVVSGIERNVRRISFEIAPGEGSPWASQFGEQFGALPLPEQQRITQVIAEPAMSAASKLSGIDLTNLVHGTGGWNMYQNPAAVGQALATREGSEIAANTLGYLLQQTEVWSNSVKPMTKNPKSFAVDFVQEGKGGNNYLATNEGLREFWEKVQQNDPSAGSKNPLFVGYQPIKTADGRPGIRVLIDRGGVKTQNALEEAINGPLTKMLEDYPTDISIRGHEAEINKARNDWTGDKDGKGYLARLEQLLGRNPAADLDPIRGQLEEIFKRELQGGAQKGGKAKGGSVGYASGGSVSGHVPTEKMKVDTYVGPHHDSTRIFIINQQHPHTKRFNDHKVMLGYKDRSHAVHDYVHSFSDGNGHKRIASIVEMDSHQLKDWLRKGNLHKPTHGSN